MYELVGYRHISGISKSKKEPYDLEILHCISGEIPNGTESYGREVETVIINRLRFPDVIQHPIVGDKLRILYNRDGHAYDYDII